jgi:hypothetical protein
MRIIEELRQIYGGTWKYSKESGHWESDLGFHIYRCAQLSPRFDGDDDSFISQLRRSDTGDTIATKWGKNYIFIVGVLPKYYPVIKEVLSGSL